ncbi:MAG: thioredoxin-disulfide reductase [Patescibacteria group bacterium]|jgi:thioredoxin reductase (NADPH)
MDIRNVIIIGSGPSGYTAAIYAGRADLRPLLIAGGEPGGQLMTTSAVENWPGEDEGIMGPVLMKNMENQAKKFGAEMRTDRVMEVDVNAHPFLVKTATETYQTKAIIVATGASARWLGVSGEDRLKGRGVSACATCDGFFFREKHVVVVGGGDAALEEATYLTRYANHVTVVVRRDALSASKPMQDRAQSNPKISFVWNSEVKEFQGEQTLQHILLSNLQTKEETILDAEGCFVAIGHKPNTDLFVGKLELDAQGYLVHQCGSMQSSVPGIFACGDVTDHSYRQAITAAGTGCMAAIDCERYLASLE